MTERRKSRLSLYRVTTQGENQPRYTGLVEVPRAGLYWIDGYVDRTAAGETYIRGELHVYQGEPPKGRQRLPEELVRGEMQVQPGFWPARSRKR